MTGHTVSMFGGSGPLAGVFGCSIDTSQTSWWNAQGGSNYFLPYSGESSEIPLIRMQLTRIVG